ncbi:MAG: hypothetical protein ACP5N5_04540 [Desulfurococcus sp.]|uniref:hypothetical protein n=1 Tax=Desulfurococcus sp. TaxID=51678 RepID=UPI003D0F04AB
MQGFPTAMTSKSYEGEPWAGVTPSERSPVIRIPRAVKPSAEDSISNPMKPEAPFPRPVIGLGN